MPLRRIAATDTLSLDCGIFRPVMLGHDRFSRPQVTVQPANGFADRPLIADGPLFAESAFWLAWLLSISKSARVVSCPRIVRGAV